MTTWKKTTVALPTTDLQVWIIRQPWWDTPTLAQFDFTTSTFDWTDPTGATWTLEPWQVWSWRPV